MTEVKSLGKIVYFFIVAGFKPWNQFIFYERYIIILWDDR